MLKTKKIIGRSCRWQLFLNAYNLRDLLSESFMIINEESHIKSFGGNFSCGFLTKRYQERVRGRG